MVVLAAKVRSEETDLGELELVDRARNRDEASAREIMRRYNQRLFRVARAVARNDCEAEDIVQETYIRAFTHLDTFRGEARLSTWLTRIALNEALGRKRQQRRTTDIDNLDALLGQNGEGLDMLSHIQVPPTPETELARSRIRDLLESAVDRLPDTFRVVFVMRDIEGMSAEEVARQLGIEPTTVRTRLFRARKLLRATLESKVTSAFSSLFPFDGARCAGMADRVVARLQRSSGW